MEDCPLCATYPAGVLCVAHDDWPEPTHPALVDARELLLLEERHRASRQDDALHRMWRCLVLAPNLTIFKALLRGEHVPVRFLDQDWLRRFRRRDAA